MLAVFSVIRQFVMIGDEALQIETPPPQLVAEFPVIVQLVIVAEELWRQ